MLRGSCLCGNVTYEIRGTPLVMYYCHCGTCQKATGTAFATNILTRAEDFVLTSGRDRLSAFESSPNKHRHFCSSCGSPIYSQAESTKHVVSVRSGTLEGGLETRPSMHTYVASKAPWYDIKDDLPQMPQGFA
ncbi:MAG TPA: GFA family protein [Candidatus Acidoferrales bacterium]|nr:GFA family protein [Candidatus Acidoferrales bacterium]